MTKLIFLCTRSTDVSKDDYARLLLEEHAPRVLSRFDGIVSLAVNLVKDGQDGFPAYDAVCEVSFSEQPRHEAIERALGKLSADVHVYRTTEHVPWDRIGDARGNRFAGVKAFYPIKRKTGSTHEEFVRHWREVHVPKAARHHPGMKRYTQNVVERRLSATGDDWDGFTEGWYPEHADYTDRLFDSPEGMRVIMDDVAQFIGQVGTYHLEEHLLLPTSTRASSSD